ncbi:MAG: HNH endonuclease [Mesorhizobium sp.]|nr:MAG: HNH endonuclease [Mesorhizobium sp.]
MSGPSEKAIRRLFAMSGNSCAFLGCPSPLVEVNGTLTGEICHIRAQSPGGPRFDASQTQEARHAYENLILLCRRHHRIVDEEPELYSVDALEELKAIGERQFGRPEQETDAFYAKLLLNSMRRVEVNNNAGNVVIASPGAIVGRTINIKAARNAMKILPAAGTIGADQDASRYVQYLIGRYNKFASADTSRATKFSYGAIAKNIEARFRAAWRALSIERLPELCGYLQERIGKTRIAKSNAAKGSLSFLTFEEYVRDSARPL